MIKYVCDWCDREFSLNEISRVKVANVFNKPIRLHICRDCARSHMPERAQGMISWTAAITVPEKL